MGCGVTDEYGHEITCEQCIWGDSCLDSDVEKDDINEITIELCEEIGIPYKAGNGCPTLNGVPITEENYEPPFPIKR